MKDRELTLANLLADPMTLAMMAADHVDPAELKAIWTALARRLASASEPEREPVCVCAGWADPSWRTSSSTTRSSPGSSWY
jgi:hypothetical protein